MTRTDSERAFEAGDRNTPRARCPAWVITGRSPDPGENAKLDLTKA